MFFLRYLSFTLRCDVVFRYLYLFWVKSLCGRATHGVYGHW